MLGALRLAASLAAALVLASCGGGEALTAAQATPSPTHAARAVVRGYLRALAEGNGAGACRLLSPRAMRDGGCKTFAACARDHRHLRPLGHFAIAGAEQQSKRSVIVWIGDAKVSDSGDDNLPVTRYGRRWLLDAD